MTSKYIYFGIPPIGENGIPRPVTADLYWRWDGNVGAWVDKDGIFKESSTFTPEYFNKYKGYIEFTNISGCPDYLRVDDDR